VLEYSNTCSSVRRPPDIVKPCRQRLWPATPLVSERWTVVLTALKVNGSRREYASFSSIATSGLPEGDGNVVRIGVIRKDKGD